MALTPDKADNSSNSSSSSSGSSSSSSGDTITSQYRNRERSASDEYYDEVCPEVVIKRTDDGLEVDRYPHTREISVGRGTEDIPDERVPVPWVRYWTYRQSWESIVRDVEQYLGEDLEQVIETDPQLALDLVNETARNFDKSHRKRDTLYVDCVLCGEEHHRLKGDYSEVDHKVVCDSHSVEQLATHGII